MARRNIIKYNKIIKTDKRVGESSLFYIVAQSFVKKQQIIIYEEEIDVSCISDSKNTEG